MKTREKASNHKELKGKINTSEQMINMGAEEGSVKCLLKDSIQVNEKIREMRRDSVWRARVRYPTDTADRHPGRHPDRQKPRQTDTQTDTQADTQADTQVDRHPGRQTPRQTDNQADTQAGRHPGRQSKQVLKEARVNPRKKEERTQCLVHE